MKICVIVARYDITGVPLAQERLAKALAARGHMVDLIIGFVAEGIILPTVASVRTIVFNKPKVRSIFSKFWRYLRSEKPDIVFTAEDHLNAVVIITAILSQSKVKISASSRVNPFDTYSTSRLSKRWFLKKIMERIMWRADVLTCVSNGMVEQYRTLFREAPHVCVYNIVETEDARQKILEEVDHPFFNDHSTPVIVAAGQLGPWKGFSDLIDAVYLVSQSHLVSLLILGEGKQRSELQEKINSLGLSDRIKLVGHVSNPLKYFAKADVFVLSSLLEGMPNVMIEAMMAGCTPVATDCPTGPREILASGRCGYLVPVQDPVALAQGIEKALRSPVPSERLAEAVMPFREDVVLAEHFRLLDL